MKYSRGLYRILSEIQLPMVSTQASVTLRSNANTLAYGQVVGEKINLQILGSLGKESSRLSRGQSTIDNGPGDGEFRDLRHKRNVPTLLTIDCPYPEREKQRTNVGETHSEKYREWEINEARKEGDGSGRLDSGNRRASVRVGTRAETKGLGYLG